MKNNRGFTLIELIVVMAIFVGVIIMTTSAFDSILRGTSQQMKSAESQIEGIVGLEMLRYDIEHAGFGLPWSFQNTSTATNYGEVSATTGVNGVNYTGLIDRPPRAPRAFVGGSATSGASYLVVKSTVAALNNSVKRWGYVNYSSSGGSYIKKWSNDPYNFTVQPGDQVITLSSSFSVGTGALDKKLVMDGGNFYTTVVTDANTNLSLPDVFKPVEPTQMYMVYTVSHPDAAGATLAMPYNRADYFVKRPADTAQIPASCNPGTGILYKATVNHGGGFTYYPLLDCVGDMQVVLQLDINDDGVAETASSQDGIKVNSPVTTAGSQAMTDTLTRADVLRQRLKQVQVYLLAHEGKKDQSFNYMRDSISVGDPVAGRVWTASTMSSAFGADWRNYRWKVYTIVVRPKNLQ